MFRPSLAVVLVAVTSALAGCGGGSDSPTAPSPPPPVQIAGSWSGTFETSNYQSLAAQMVLTQTGSTIGGTWQAPSGGNVIQGTISGTVDSSSYTGIITFSISQSSSCSGSFSGSATASALNWSSALFTGNCNTTPNGNPANPKFVMQRR